jgi:hypothetical protein
MYSMARHFLALQCEETEVCGAGRAVFAYYLSEVGDAYNWHSTADRCMHLSLNRNGIETPMVFRQSHPQRPLSRDDNSLGNHLYAAHLREFHAEL